MNFNFFTKFIFLSSLSLIQLSYSPLFAGDEERGHESYWDKLPDGNVLQDPVERTMGGAGDAGMDPTIFAQDSQSEEDMIQQVRLGLKKEVVCFL